MTESHDDEQQSWSRDGAGTDEASRTPSDGAAAARESSRGVEEKETLTFSVKSEKTSFDPQQRNSAMQSQATDPLRPFLAEYDGVTADVGMPRTRTVDSPRYLSFDLAGERYAASILYIREIIRVSGITPVPRAQDSVLGVISKRGLVMPVIDLSACLGLRSLDRASHPKQRVLVVGSGDDICGLRVDEIFEVIPLSAAAIESVPSTVASDWAGVLFGLGRVNSLLHILLDTEALMAFLRMGHATSKGTA